MKLTKVLSFLCLLVLALLALKLAVGVVGVAFKFVLVAIFGLGVLTAVRLLWRRRT